jgi:hypothetical protein
MVWSIQNATRVERFAGHSVHVEESSCRIDKWPEERNLYEPAVHDEVRLETT